jgi:hypothetical protein
VRALLCPGAHPVLYGSSVLYSALQYRHQWCQVRLCHTMLLQGAAFSNKIKHCAEDVGFLKQD